MTGKNKCNSVLILLDYTPKNIPSVFGIKETIFLSFCPKKHNQ